MKKLLAILSIAVLLCSCAAEKRLARFLERHPELHRIDTVYYHDTIVRPAEANTVNLTLSELIAMDSIASVALTEDQDTTTAHLATVNVSGNRSNATLQALGNGLFQMTASAPADTFYIEVPVEVPTYVTEYKDREVPVYKQKWYQEGFMWIGIIAFIIIVLYFGIKALKTYIKPI